MSWTHYLLQANLYLLIFYGFYKLLLDKETYFVLNRVYLLLAGILSFSIPFLRFDWFAQPAVLPLYNGANQLNELMTQVSVVENSPERWSVGSVVVLIYISGVLFFAGKFIYQLLSLRNHLEKAEQGSAFSFFRKKIVDQDLPQFQTINRHEDIHIRQLHTLDILFFELISIVTWFNPIVYLYKHTIKSIHEYLADEEAARFQGDKQQYALLLLGSALGVPPNALTNSFFNKSLIKRRIFMLHKQRSKRAAILKYGLFLPLFAVTLVMSSATIRKNEKILAVADEIPLEQPIAMVKDIVKQIAPEKPATEKNNTTAIVGKIDQDWQDFYMFVKRQIMYPTAAHEKKLQGNSQIKFTLVNGEIENLGTASKALGEGCDAEVMKTILAYKGFKAASDGKYIFTVSFRLTEANTPVQNEKAISLTGYTNLNNVVITAYGKRQSTTDDDNKVYDFVSIEKQPTFVGGMENFYAYLKSAVKYPEEAKANKVQGRVYLSFIVEKDGSLTSIHVRPSNLVQALMRKLSGYLKHHLPGYRGSVTAKLSRVKYNIPITFALDNPKLTIKGKTEGIQIKGNNTLTIGGENSPLYIIDGEKQENTKLMNLDPNDIQVDQCIKR